MTNKKKNENRNDALGKVHETLLAYNLVGNSWPAVVHFRANGGTPEEIHYIAANTIGHNDYVAVSENTFGLSKLLLDHMYSGGLIANVTDVHSVAWTSNRDTEFKAGDHEMFTGVKDTSSDADVIVRNHSGSFVGISLKYGTTRDPNMKNSGMSSLEDLLDLGGVLSLHRDDHISKIVSMGYSGNIRKDHETWKSDVGSERYFEAKRSSLECRRRMAGEIRNRLKEGGQELISSVVENLLISERFIRHIRTHTRPHKSGTEYYIHDPETYIKEKLRDLGDFAVIDAEGTVITIKADRDGEDCTVLRLGLKSQSGPMKNVVCTVAAPFLKDGRRKKKVLYCFDLDLTLFWHEEEGSPMVAVHSQDGTMVDMLDSSAYSDHSLPLGCYYSYDEFKSAEIFEKTARPIERMLDTYRKKASTGSDVCIVTARHGFDRPDEFLRILAGYGIECPVHMTGEGRSISENTSTAKKKCFRRLLEDGKYTEIWFWDDNESNLRGFLELSDDFPDVKFKARMVKWNQKKKKCKVEVVK